jgi:hypothetical protein
VKKVPAIRVFPLNREKKSFPLKFDSYQDIENVIARQLKYEI